MKWSIIKNDFLRNKVINIALLLFMMFSASLAVTSVLMGTQTFSAIGNLYEVAAPPHFLQMHKGEIDENKVNEFMESRDEVIYSQIVTMINVYPSNILIENENKSIRLSDLRLDVGIVKQNAEKDLLLNADHEKAVLNKGEVGISIILKDMYDIKIGDTFVLEINEIRKEYEIVTFVLDAQMNSTMASSTRILLSDSDYEEINGKIGEYEYLIEAYFASTNEANAFQTIYENGSMPQNGQAVTYSMIFLLSALTDITTVFVLLLVSILLIIVAFVSVRFTIMASLEEDVREIGTMKAIGLTHKDIVSIYSSKYNFLALVAVVFGFILAILLNGIFTKHITTTFGNMNLIPIAIISAIIVSIIVYFLIKYYCKKILKKLKKITVVAALVNGEGLGSRKVKVRDGFNKIKKLPVNLSIGLRDAFYGFKTWIIIFFIVVISFMMIMIPVNLLNTFESPEFITYMGSSLEDVLIEVENGNDLDARHESVINLLENNDIVKEYYEYKTVRLKTKTSNNILMNLEIDTGFNSGIGLQYLSGSAPSGDNEIALSYLNAQEIGKAVGETIELIYGDETKPYKISGIYQDVTSGGKTAKSQYAFPDVDALNYSFSINLEDGYDPIDIANDWQKKLGNKVTVDPMDEFIDQTLGGVANQLRSFVIGIIVIGAMLVMLITVLFLKLKLAKDSSEIAVLKAIGFKNKDISTQYMIKIGFIAIIGVIIGFVLSLFLDEPIINMALSFAGLGITKVNLIINPLMQTLITPILLIVLIELVTWIVMKTIRKYNIIAIINE